ncbi:MAG: hypothetical protein QRY74_03150 [Chlamydia sp.]
MSDAPILDFFSEDFTLFIEAGFVAIKQSDEIAARRLFKTAEVLKPESVTPQIGLGYIALNKLLITESVSIFEGVLAKEPANHLARALLGVSYLLTKDKKKQGELLVQEAKRLSDDPTIHNLAETCMQWMEKDLLKSNFSPLNSPLGKADNQ